MGELVLACVRISFVVLGLCICSISCVYVGFFQDVLYYNRCLADDFTGWMVFFCSQVLVSFAQVEPQDIYTSELLRHFFKVAVATIRLGATQAITRHKPASPAQIKRIVSERLLSKRPFRRRVQANVANGAFPYSMSQAACDVGSSAVLQ